VRRSARWTKSSARPSLRSHSSVSAPSAPSPFRRHPPELQPRSIRTPRRVTGSHAPPSCRHLYGLAVDMDSRSRFSEERDTCPSLRQRPGHPALHTKAAARLDRWTPLRQLSTKNLGAYGDAGHGRYEFDGTRPPHSNAPQSRSIRKIPSTEPGETAPGEIRPP